MSRASRSAFAFMIGAVGLGFGTIFIAYPVLQTILKYAGVAYLIYLAVAIAMSGPVKSDQDSARRPDDLLGRSCLPVDQRQGLGDGDRHYHRLCRHCQLSLEYHHTGHAQPVAGSGVLLDLGAVRQRAAAGPDLAPRPCGPSTSSWRCCCWPRSIRSSWTHDAALRHAETGFPEVKNAFRQPRKSPSKPAETSENT